MEVNINISRFITPFLKGSPSKNAVWFNVAHDGDLFDIGKQVADGTAYPCMAATDYNECRDIPGTYDTPLLYRCPLSGRSFNGIPECVFVSENILLVEDANKKDDKSGFERGFYHCMASGYLYECIMRARPAERMRIDGSDVENMINEVRVHYQIGEIDLNDMENTNALLALLRMFVEERQSGIVLVAPVMRLLVKARIEQIRKTWPGQCFYFGGGVDYLHLGIPAGTADATEYLEARGLCMHKRVAVLPALETIARNCGWTFRHSGADIVKEKTGFLCYRTVDQIDVQKEVRSGVFTQITTSNMRGVTVLAHQKGAVRLDSIQVASASGSILGNAKLPMQYGQMVVFWVDMEARDIADSTSRPSLYAILELFGRIPEIDAVVCNYKLEEHAAPAKGYSALKELPLQAAGLGAYADKPARFIHLYLADSARRSLLSRNLTSKMMKEGESA